MFTLIYLRQGFQIVLNTDCPYLSNLACKGDFNGDGIDDAVVTCVSTNQVHLIVGARTGVVRATTILGPLTLIASPWTLQGGWSTLPDASPRFGTSVSMGDVNGDGFSDIITSAPWESFNGTAFNGRAYVIYGSNSTRRLGMIPAAITSTAAINGTLGFAINPPPAMERLSLGMTVAAIGDHNGDGIGDIAVSGFNEDAGGVVYVVYGVAASSRTAVTLPLPASVSSWPQVFSVSSIHSDTDA